MTKIINVFKFSTPKTTMFQGEKIKKMQHTSVVICLVISTFIVLKLKNANTLRNKGITKVQEIKTFLKSTWLDPKFLCEHSKYRTKKISLYLYYKIII